MPEITVMPQHRHVEFSAGSSLMDILLAEGIFVDNPCNGRAICGKCKVRAAGGVWPDLLEEERQLLTPAEIADGVRLSCAVVPTGDLTVELMEKERKHEVLTTGVMPSFSFEPDVTKALVEIRKPTLDDQTPFEEQIRAQLGGARIDYAALLGGRLEPGAYTAVLHDGSVVQLEPGDTSASLCGVAIDIGTTTVVCELVDLLTGAQLAASSQVNAQKKFGQDVLTRITYELEHPENGALDLQKAIVDSLNAMIFEVCAETGVDRAQVYEVTVGANCTMMHMLLGVDATPIGKAPFAPVFSAAKDIPAASIGLEVARGARLYCLPQVSAYIGADIVAGAYVCQLAQEPGNVLFMDIGTNGEIVLASHGRLLSCSCAAGPALEGMNISSGMRAAEGAIEDVHLTPEGADIAVIGNETPVGLCGSGILAAVRELLASGIVRKNGAFVKLGAFGEDDWRAAGLLADDKGKRSYAIVEEPHRIAITQSDVRQVQLAKGALLSGFIALMKSAGITMEQLDKVIIAGQFGAHLPIDSITRTGILPTQVEGIIEYAGNTSKTGAYMALMSASAKREMEQLAREMDYMELGATEGYERLFSECLIFPTNAPGNAPARKEG